MGAKTQSQATMGQLADLSQQYSELTTNHNKMSIEYEKMKVSLNKNNEELDKVKGDMVFSKQQEIQQKLTLIKQENATYAKSIKGQQERILSLQDQLQSSQMAV